MSPPDEGVDTALEMIDHLFKITADIAHRISSIEQALPSTQPGEARSDYRFENYPNPSNDTDRTNQEQRALEAWTRLHNWVDWLVTTYRLTTTVPPCWPEHPTITEELIGLRIAWLGAWRDTSTPDAITTWHERLHRTKARLNDGNWGHPRCSGTHPIPDHTDTWLNHPTRYPALTNARTRALDDAGHLTTASPSQP
jgi:hypothetical protein